MLIRLCPGLAALVAVAVIGLAPAPAQAQYPALWGALHELRQAHSWLKEAKADEPPGYKDRALTSIESAIASIQKILESRGETDFYGPPRGPDYYRRYQDHPKLRSALDDLREARDILRPATTDYDGYKDHALDDIDIAVGDVLTLIRNGKR